MEPVIKPYAMRKPRIGDEVTVHENMNNYDPSKAKIGRVTAVYDEIIQAQLWPSGRAKESLRFIDDPGLAQNEHWRNNGAWDWGPTTKRIMALEEQVSQLTMALAAVRVPFECTSETTDDPWADVEIDELRELADAHHVEVKKLCNRKTLIAKLREAGVKPPTPVGVA